MICSKATANKKNRSWSLTQRKWRWFGQQILTDFYEIPISKSNNAIFHMNDRAEVWKVSVQRKYHEKSGCEQIQYKVLYVRTPIIYSSSSSIDASFWIYWNSKIKHWALFHPPVNAQKMALNTHFYWTSMSQTQRENFTY